ncbi:hypothetical protein GA0061098_10446 [Bradyrhizobium shewense]|uniref:Uncharacterized protein n=1 Tax=Bradyrhizobium shewense TaxID=1761772 RepID=A0A1C3XU18_9BRAD|nr:hypothetical protein GA0061098_10446 [Bradyrhizobium shewense]
MYLHVWHRRTSRSPLCYFRTVGLADAVLGLGEIANVSQVFQPSGLFCAANSQYPFRFT